ncbi:MAG: aminopeptidase P N-terminal domain-containing protein, partial [Alkalimonas sp.]|nr:aminopeptidase P N-terminal domain-containing protein [Alkalimonas sp.]
MEHATADRRARLLAQLPVSTVALIPAAREQTRSRDTEYPFRQASDFWYLTAFPEPDALLILAKDEQGQCSELLLCRDKDPQAEVWQGRRYGTEQAEAVFGVPAASLSQQSDAVLDALRGKQQLYFSFGADPLFDQHVFAALEQIRSTPRQSELVPTAIHDLRPVLSEMRLIKDQGEIALMQHAARISAEAHTQAMLLCQPGVYEYQLEASLLQHFATADDATVGWEARTLHG